MLLLFCITLVDARAQEGIRFETSRWTEVLASAKKQDKLVFVDMYTSWCGPCKQMMARVFPQPKVAAYFNQHFVNYKLDAEKGEGVAVAAKYSVKAYPTYLFVDAKGQLVYRISGYQEAEKLLAEAAVAQQEKNDPRPFVLWNEKYEKGERDKDFLLGYLHKCAQLKLSSADIVEEAMPLLTDSEWLSKDQLSDIVYYDANVQAKPAGHLFDFVLKHHASIDEIMDKKPGYSLGLLQFAIRNYFYKQVIPTKNDLLLAATRNSYDKIAVLLKQSDRAASARRWAMDYYSKTNQPEKLIVAARDFVYEGLLTMHIDSLQHADSLDYLSFMQALHDGKIDSGKIDNWDAHKRIRRNKRMIDLSYQLRDAAEAIYHNTNNIACLQEACRWAYKANSWFPHFSSEAVYAALLFKTGNLEKGVAAMQLASRDSILDSNNSIRQLLEQNASAMQQSQAPEKVW
jgi:thioredoxin-related protein